MARMITALFDSRADAEAARDRLKASKVDISGIHIVDKATEGYHADTYSTTQNKGIWGSIKSAFLPDEDRHTLEEGVHRGGFVLSGQVSDDQADNAVQVLDNANSIDLDKRSSDWHAAGWNPAMAASKPMPPKAPVRDDARLGATGDQMIPVYEEQLVVGKREVARGGARVRSYIVETPVHEQVRLREEHVEVERRPVNQPISATDGDVFRERTIAMTETAEEAAVGKTARVVEEISLRKEVGGLCCKNSVGPRFFV